MPPVPHRHPAATIVVCAYNAEEQLRTCLPAALRQDYRGPFSVLVVDNTSSDQTAAVARELGARVVPCRRRGVVFARQAGWRRARTPIVAFLDADCEPPAHWLRALIDLLEREPGMAAVGARLANTPPQTLAERHIAEARILDTDRFWEENALQFPFLATAGLVLRRRALEEIGGFDLSFGRNAGEDADLCWRLRRAGWGMEYARDVQVIHHHRSTLSGMLRQAHWYGRGASATFARWRGDLGYWRYTDWGALSRGPRALAALPGALIRGRDRYERLRPLLEIADSAAFLSGKWRGAWENRVLFF